MLKYSHFLGDAETGPTAIPLFGPADSEFEKTAAPTLLPEVVEYIATLQPRNDSQYVLVNAMGAGEYYGSNINGDHFPEAALIHKPSDWTGNPLVDRARARTWPYGFPTFYLAHPYAHHRNKDPKRAFGGVELAAWNEHMKRVELIVRVDHERCQQFGGIGVWDKLISGKYPDVSMGCVPAGTRVMLADGSFKQMECMQEGDQVITHVGKVCCVEEALRYQYEGTLYRFKAYGFPRELCLTENHPLWLVRGEQLVCKPTAGVNKGRKQRHCTPLVKSRGKGCMGCETTPRYGFEWVRADEAEVGDYVAFPVPSAVDATVSSVDEARFLGFYLAGGHVGSYNDHPLEQITFSLGFEEKELAEEIESLGRKLGATVSWHSEDKDRGGRYVTVVSKELADRCLRFCGSGAKTKQLSREALYMCTELQKAFLGAYLDGDGGTYKGSAYFSTSSEQLADQLFVALARCGMISSINTINHIPSARSVVRKETVEYQVWVGTDFSPVIGPYTRKPVRASKKVRGQRFFYEYEGTKYILSPILEIVEEDYRDDVFNISVKGDDSYVSELIATHNTKVPYDTCAICLDWDEYTKALLTYKDGKHKHPGEAVLIYHKAKKAKDGVGIRGLSITRADYCEHARKMMNRILPDGRKVWVYNDFPRFFDISFVFIGADKIAKVMMYISRMGVPAEDEPRDMVVGEPVDATLEKSAERKPPHAWSWKTRYETRRKNGWLPKDKPIKDKVASLDDLILKTAFGKLAKPKSAEIKKDVVPSQFAGKAVPLLTQAEGDIPREVLEALSDVPLGNALSTTAGMGVLLRPREFQRILLTRMGRRDEADELEGRGTVFPRMAERVCPHMAPELFMPSLARLLLPLLAHRSALGPEIERRVVVLSSFTPKKEASCSSHTPELLHKIGAAYNGYRSGALELVAQTQGLTANLGELEKQASAPVDSIFTPLAVHYIHHAYWDEVGQPGATGRVAGVERGRPS